MSEEQKENKTDYFVQASAAVVMEVVIGIQLPILAIAEDEYPPAVLPKRGYTWKQTHAPTSF